MGSGLFLLVSSVSFVPYKIHVHLHFGLLPLSWALSASIGSIVDTFSASAVSLAMRLAATALKGFTVGFATTAGELLPSI
ncbi:hypothetical protein BX666DRAFT_233040 [Dichotomocladium elegans]|nr:hypothetical protein BX666DRAFT_233040 [Dichotomocladium elegans]